MRTLIACITLGAALVPVQSAAQNLTPSQKDADFRYLASLYATYYAPLTWKNQLFKFDALDLRPWLAKAVATTSDLDFYELEAAYISGLNDSHVQFSLPSDFSAQLGFGVDLYDGVLLIDTINRTLLPSAQYPFVIGDELVSLDGEDALALAAKLAKYVPQGNPRASLRQGAQRVTSRAQSRFPHATDLGDSAKVVIRRQSGVLDTYTIPWIKTGTPLEVGPVPSPRSVMTGSAEGNRAVIQVDPLEELRFSGVLPQDSDGVNGYGARNPIFLGGLGAGFSRRLGGAAADFFYSGVFAFAGLRIGYIRIPNYSPASQATAFRQFETEVTFMNANTDGLIVDEMRNTGGSLCFGEELARRLTPYEFRATGFAVRAFWGRVLGFYNAYINAVATNQPAEVVAMYKSVFDQMLAANQEGRVVTNPLPICSSSLMRQPLLAADGSLVAYQKPIMVMVDDFSTSTADSFAGMMQDSGRAVLYGMRTNGAGGNNTSFDAGTYSESFVGMTLALQVRKAAILADGFPATDYIENVGVRPQVVNDYMTKANLLNGGATFVSQFLQSMADYIRGQPSARSFYCRHEDLGKPACFFHP